MTEKKDGYKPGHNPRSVAALKAHAPKPGETRNPKGRPVNALCLTSSVRELLKETHPKHRTKKRIRVIAEEWATRAEKNSGDLQMLLDRVEGRLPQTVAGVPGAPIVLIEKIVAHVKEEE